ncbi:MAG: hypothetical protein CMH94_03400 [Oceanicaulis sp.]|uniref:DUF819 family protein n=1 Tax=Maricaulis virginensis TaxID=144022 RepID=A0A9W6MMI1_9PROT|nr:DUF819 family protein [Maricaulis virginensis]MAC39758.1 hypothetical protein [Oceanicaulis sp.]MBI74627.1 hypothetical protein [Oceanicaulis sp.]GLK50891.1 hypothetical protein GCM10017621_03990 [Maricaulis virginensis]
MSLIPADNHLAVMAALFTIAAVAFLLEKTRIGALVTGTVSAIFIAILAANLRIIPSSAPAYDFVWTYFVPVLIPLFLMKADLKRIFFETTRMAAAFMLASAATVIGAVIAFSLIHVGDYEAGAVAAEYGSRQAAAAGAFTATYIGGSVNYGALMSSTGLGAADPSFASAMTAVDNLYSGFFLALLAIIPGVSWIASRFVQRDHSQGEIEVAGEDPISPASLTLSMAYALVVVALGSLVADLLDQVWDDAGRKWKFAIISVLSLIPATAFPKTMGRLRGGYEIGIALSFVFFAMIAAGADVVSLLQLAPVLMLLIGILLVVHAIVLFGLGSLLRLSLPELITASNAAILGATTAPALAAAKGWKDLVTPGVLVGVLGYAIGTPIATLVFEFWPG